MIYYFSGTGNSRWAAESIAALTGEKTCDITTLTAPPEVHGEKRLGFVFPVHSWDAPEVMNDFVATLERTSAFTFAVCTCGEEAGLTMKKFAARYPLHSCYSLVMPSNYVIAADVDDEKTVWRKFHAAYWKIRQLSQEVLRKERVYRVHEGPLSRLKSGPINYGFNHYGRRTKPFHVGEQCVGCGTCARQCPAGAIAMAAGRPVWQAAMCHQCLRCLNACPQRAIQYGPFSKKFGRYTIDMYLGR